jgi:uncharacterized protein (UPF0332 family)
MTQAERNEIVQYRIDRANESLQEVEVLIEHQLYNGAVNRLYYACYYAVSALLLHHGIEAQTHSGARQQFGLHFIKEGLIDVELGKFYSAIFNSRQTGDYDDLVMFDKNKVMEFIDPAKNLITRISELLS